MMLSLDALTKISKLTDKQLHFDEGRHYLELKDGMYLIEAEADRLLCVHSDGSYQKADSCGVLTYIENLMANKVKVEVEATHPDAAHIFEQEWSL